MGRIFDQHGDTSRGTNMVFSVSCSCVRVRVCGCCTPSLPLSLSCVRTPLPTWFLKTHHFLADRARVQGANRDEGKARNIRCVIVASRPHPGCQIFTCAKCYWIFPVEDGVLSRLCFNPFLAAVHLCAVAYPLRISWSARARQESTDISLLDRRHSPMAR